jgi:MFS family permease
MGRSVELLRNERRARVFFVAHTQSALGTGAAYVALLLVAYERFRSPWAISLVLVADLIPPMVLGPVLGAAADRWSRRLCMVVADVIRAIAFVGLALVNGFEATVALALLAGAGTALFTPASLAALPSLVEERRLPAAMSLFGAIRDLGLAVGPAIVAALLLFTDPETILVANAVTFVVSALLLARLDFGRAPEWADSAGREGARPLLAQAQDGVRAVRGIVGLWTLLLASCAAVFFGGLVNVAELPFITDELDASDAAFSAVVALFGVGIAAGSLAGGAGGTPNTLRRRYLLGLVITSVGLIVAGLSQELGGVAVGFLVAAFGNGLMLVHERLIIHAAVPDRLRARVFGLKDSLTAWSWAAAFVLAGGLVTAAGSRTVITLTGAGIAAVALIATLRLREIRPQSSAPPHPTGPIVEAPSHAPVEAHASER